MTDAPELSKAEYEEDLKRKAYKSLRVHPGYQYLVGWMLEEQSRELKHLLNGRNEDVIWKRLGRIDFAKKLLNYVEAQASSN